ncbi:helix-turn-helix domain-containing protein [Amycolatopsis palatopharyngis]|uniref:helix-turn-helix domain-containing protein n=1 Tax=Amycolatopsis palatopharyngis TaxID=187982 RepID=UPI0013BEAA56|nr:LuxR C-terminal-related transcriptional regulator [Amycolatopsis palatopharyngis]
MRAASSRTGFSALSDREREVLLLIAEDKTDREIARELGISERTVRAHVSRIILKLGVASRVGAAVIATRWRVTTELHPLA